MKKWELGKSKYIASIYKDISQNLSELGLTVDCPPANVEHTQVNFLELLTKAASIVKHDIIKIGHGKLCIANVQVFVNLKMGKISQTCLMLIFYLCAWFENMWISAQTYSWYTLLFEE